MSHATLRLRLIELMQKSRQALRLYSHVGRFQNQANTEYTEAQAAEWRTTNMELLRELSSLVNLPGGKGLVGKVFYLRDRLQSEFRQTETEVHTKQKDLIRAAENGDFVKATLLGRSLVTLKSRLDATQAAQHEVEDAINKSRVTPPTIELTDDKIVRQTVKLAVGQGNIAQVIPIRRHR